MTGRAVYQTLTQIIIIDLVIGRTISYAENRGVYTRIVLDLLRLKRCAAAYKRNP